MNKEKELNEEIDKMKIYGLSRKLRYQSKRFLECRDALERFDFAKVRRLIEVEGFNVNEQDDYGWTVLHCCTRKKKSESVEWLLRWTDVKRERKTTKGQTALQMAIELNHVGLVDIIKNTTRSADHYVPSKKTPGNIWQMQEQYNEKDDEVLLLERRLEEAKGQRAKLADCLNLEEKSPKSGIKRRLSDLDNEDASNRKVIKFESRS